MLCMAAMSGCTATTDSSADADGAAAEGGSDVGAGASSESEVEFDGERIVLIDGFQPEGIAAGPGSLAYVGTMTGGGIIEVDLATGARRFLVEPEIGVRAFAGLAYDAKHDHIFACGAWFQNGFVYDASSGAQLAKLQFPGNAGVVNGVAVTADWAFFSDSLRAAIYRVALDSDGLPAGEIQDVVLTGDFDFVEVGNNGNGIVAAGGTMVFLLNSANGTLYRIDSSTGEAARVEVSGGVIDHGDGLSYVGDDLLVVRNGATRGGVDEVVRLRLDESMTSADVVGVGTSAAFAFPTTAAVLGDDVWVVNARLDDVIHGATKPDDAFDLVRVHLPRG